MTTIETTFDAAENQNPAIGGNETPIKNEETKNPCSDNTTPANDEMSLIELARLIGKNGSFLYLIERGYYWDPDENCVVPGPDATGEPPSQPSRAARRKMQRDAQRLRVEQRKHQEQCWSRLYRNLCEPSNTESDQEPVSQCESDLEKQDDSIGQPTEDEHKDVVPREQEANTVPEEEKGASRKKADVINALLQELGPNGILRFFTWVIEHIAMTILANPELRSKFLTSEAAFTRNRKISLTDLFMCLLTMGGDNMNHELYEFFKMALEHPSTPAMVNRRKLLKAERCG